MILWAARSFCGLVDLSETISRLHESLSGNLPPWPSKTWSAFLLCSQIFFFFSYYPLQVWKYKWPWKGPEGIWFSFLTSNWLLLLKRKLREIYSPERWVEKMMLFQCKIIPGLCVCVCVCVCLVGGVAGERRRRRVETEGGLREMPISTGNSIWQLHGDKPISMNCQGVLYELATCPLWIGMGLTSSFQTLHQTANGHMIMIFSH